jgi:hypothetical protein
VKTREEFVKLRVRQDAEMLRIKLSYVSGSVLCELLSRGLTAYIVEARDWQLRNGSHRRPTARKDFPGRICRLCPDFDWAIAIEGWA